MCFDTSDILNLSLQSQQSHPTLHVSKWCSLLEKTGIHPVVQSLLIDNFLLGIFCIFVSLSKYKIQQVFLTKEARDWCEFSSLIRSRQEHSMFRVHTRRKIYLYFINLIFIIKKFMNLMYNPSFISFLQHMPDWSIYLLYPALSRSSSVSCRSVALHLWTSNIHKISIFKPSEFQM